MPVGLPVPGSIYERAVLFDTGAYVGIVDWKDRFHKEATQFLSELRQTNYPIYVTLVTVAETHRQLLYNLGRPAAVRFLDSIYDGSNNIVYSLNEDALQAVHYIKRFQDQPLTFTDAINMAVMKRLGIYKVFTFDWHFTLLGFQVLPGVLR